MLLGPKVTDNDFTEQDGVLAVAGAVRAARSIWRETLTRDVGIDGQIEYVAPDGTVTGRLVGVQVKSGRSYFRRRDGDSILFEPGDGHAAYWAAWPLPVILVLHDPTAATTIWTDARAALRRGERPIRVSLAQAFDAAGVIRALETTGPLPTGEDLDLVLRQMATAHTGDVSFGMSFLDLFAQGIADLAHSLYFGMDLAVELAESSAAHEGLQGIGVGGGAFAFIDQYVAFLVAENLARVDYDAWRQAEIERQMVGTFLAPLTQRGRALVELIVAKDHSLLGPPEDWARPIEERPVQIVPLRVDTRSARLRDLRTAILAEAGHAEARPA